MPQTSYGFRQTAAIAGLLGESGRGRAIRTFVNAEASAQMPFGILVARGTAFDDAKLLTAPTDPIVGAIVHSHDLGVDGATAGSSLAGTAGVDVKDRMNVMEFGTFVGLTEVAMSPGNNVYVRVATGTGTVIGAFRNANDSGTCKLMKSMRVIKQLTTTLALFWIDMNVDNVPGDEVEIPFSNASLSATFATKIFKNRTDRHFLVEQVHYDNPTGLAASDTNYFALAIKNPTKSGTPSPATWSTKLTGGQGALVADTYIVMVNDATLANTVLNPGDELQFVGTLTGAATLAIGQGVIHGRYL